MLSADVWDFYNEFREQRTNLTQVQVAVLAICDLRQEVNSGGFDRYFRYWGGDSAVEALTRIGSSLGPDWEDLLREALALFGAPYPVDTDERQGLLDELDLDDQLEALDQRFFELEISGDTDSLLWARLNRAS